jgi:hypothetical protein
MARVTVTGTRERRMREIELAVVAVQVDDECRDKGVPGCVCDVDEWEDGWSVMEADRLEGSEKVQDVGRRAQL